MPATFGLFIDAAYKKVSEPVSELKHHVLCVMVLTAALHQAD